MKTFKQIISIILILLAILIGSPISYNCYLLSLVIVLLGIIFCFYKFFIKKEKIIENKLEWLILFFCITPLIPLLFNTYISLNDTVTSLLKYVSCFTVFILIRNIIKTDEKFKNIIINIIIFSTIFLCIIGIDELTTRYFYELLKNIGLPYVINLEGRMFSSLGYTNSFAIILAVSIILILNRINNRTKKYEIIYSGVLFLNLSCLILTYSRAVFVFFTIAIIAYLLINNNKKIFTIYLLGLNVITSLIYVSIYSKFNVWLITILMFIISSLFIKLLDKIYYKIEKISKKSYIILFLITIIVIILAIVIGLNLTKPLIIFEEGSNDDEVRYNIENIDNNQEYVLEFDISSKSKSENIQNYTICVREENKYYDTVIEHEIYFSNFEGTKEIKFTTSDETIRLVVFFRNNSNENSQGLTVNSLKINGEEHILNYLYLPVSLVDKIKSINIENKSVWERGTYYSDSLKIIKDNWISGLGANAWNYSYIEIQSYNYSAKEVHSYILQLILEYGSVSLVLFIIIVAIVFVNFIKSIKNKENITVYIALFLLLAHSIVDFDMSFFYIMVIFFTLLALINNKKIENQNNEKSKIGFVLLIFVYIFVLLIGIGNLININYLQGKLEKIDTENSDSNAVVDTIKEIREYEKNDLYIDILIELDYSIVSEENFEYLYNELKDIPITVNIEYDMQKNRLIEKIITTSNNEKIIEKFSDIIINQNEEFCNMIENKDKNRLTESEQESYLLEQENILNSILEVSKEENINE